MLVFVDFCVSFVCGVFFVSLGVCVFISLFVGEALVFLEPTNMEGTRHTKVSGSMSPKTFRNLKTENLHFQCLRFIIFFHAFVFR